MKAYNAGDYKTAIREFSSAQSLAPADLNNYNLALCYDKLGDAEPAVQYYKAYLDKVPGTDKRAEIEASMQRLDSALKSSAAKKAEEARKADEAKRQIDAKKAADEDAARKKAEEDAARKAAEEAKRPPPDDDSRGTIGPALPGGAGVGSTGTPSTGQVRPTGDSQLDRVNSINIDEVRDRRVGGASSGIADRKRPPSRVDPRGGVDPALDTTEPAREGPRTAVADPRGAQPAAEPAAPTDKPKQTPVYKKWWFWAVVGVSAYVLYSIASEDSQSSQARTMLPQGSAGSTGSSGVTLMRF
ncbi:MAG: tetratricopeptide repeat protein [Deltaproteobacteria bacterium]|nr:tetratricopeptide repeat protein [Deltaproteobacteria bacterium]